jgi:hypothetical protein
MRWRLDNQDGFTDSSYKCERSKTLNVQSQNGTSPFGTVSIVGGFQLVKAML